MGRGMEMEIGVIGAVISKFYCTHRGEKRCEAQGPWAQTVTLGEQEDAGQVDFSYDHRHTQSAEGKL